MDIESQKRYEKFKTSKMLDDQNIPLCCTESLLGEHVLDYRVKKAVTTLSKFRIMFEDILSVQNYMDNEREYWVLVKDIRYSTYTIMVSH